MVEYHQQSSTTDTKPYGYGHSHDVIAGLQVIQYRSYQRAISIYHLRTHLLSLHLICAVLQNQKKYLDKLTSFDPLHNLDIVEGDEIPPGCIEAAYLPSVLLVHGSALALRTEQESEKVEWFIFSGPVDDTVLALLVCINGSWALQEDTKPEEPRKILNVVGYAEKGLATRTVKRVNREHRGWYDSLCAAEERRKNLKLTWRGFGAELSAEHDRRRLKEMKESMHEHDEKWDGNILMGDREGKTLVPQKTGSTNEINADIQSRRLVRAKETKTLSPNTTSGIPPPQRHQRSLVQKEAKG